jgi:hypothetical protein
MSGRLRWILPLISLTIVTISFFASSAITGSARSNPLAGNLLAGAIGLLALTLGIILVTANLARARRRR